ncbi:MAG: OmpA family protein [Bacteroidota bacterium]
MRKLWTPIVSLLLISWLVGGFLWTEAHQVDLVKESAEELPLLTVSNKLLSVESEVPFDFAPSKVQPILNRAVDTFVYQIKEHLKAGDRQLILRGKYLDKETNPSSFDNLGLARAEAIKKLLVNRGIAAEQLLTSGQISHQLVSHKQHWVNAVSFDLQPFEQQKKNEVEEAVGVNLEVAEAVRPLNLYFASSQYKISKSPALEQYVEELKAFLDQHKLAKVHLCGYSDDKGDRKHNIRVSKYRARKVRDFLIAEGIAKKRIRLEYKGPDHPIATNDTEEGRKKNRRVEVRVK